MINAVNGSAGTPLNSPLNPGSSSQPSKPNVAMYTNPVTANGTSASAGPVGGIGSTPPVSLKKRKFSLKWLIVGLVAVILVVGLGVGLYLQGQSQNLLPKASGGSCQGGGSDNCMGLGRVNCGGRSESNCNAVSSCGCGWVSDNNPPPTQPPATQPPGNGGGGGSSCSGASGCSVTCTDGTHFADACPANGAFSTCSQWANQACGGSHGGVPGGNSGGGTGGGSGTCNSSAVTAVACRGVSIGAACNGLSNATCQKGSTASDGSANCGCVINSGVSGLAPGQPCSTNSNCSSNSCVNNVCAATPTNPTNLQNGAICTSSTQCTSHICSGGVCISSDQNTKLSNGNSCTSDTNCSSGYCNHDTPRKCATSPTEPACTAQSSQISCEAISTCSWIAATRGNPAHCVIKGTTGGGGSTGAPLPSDLSCTDVAFNATGCGTYNGCTMSGGVCVAQSCVSYNQTQCGRDATCNWTGTACVSKPGQGTGSCSAPSLAGGTLPNGQRRCISSTQVMYCPVTGGAAQTVTCQPGYKCVADANGVDNCQAATTQAACGDGFCAANETTTSCPADCGGNASATRCASSVDCVGVGTGYICQATPYGKYCVKEVSPSCGNKICEINETNGTCPEDCSNAPDCHVGGTSCGAGLTCNPAGLCVSTTAVCGNNVCDLGENRVTCSKDCSPDKPVCPANQVWQAAGNTTGYCDAVQANNCTGASYNNCNGTCRWVGSAPNQTSGSCQVTTSCAQFANDANSCRASGCTFTQGIATTGTQNTCTGTPNCNFGQSDCTPTTHPACAWRASSGGGSSDGYCASTASTCPYLSQNSCTGNCKWTPVTLAGGSCITPGGGGGGGGGSTNVCTNNGQPVAEYRKFVCPQGCQQTTGSDGVVAYRCDNVTPQISSNPLTLAPGECGQVDQYQTAGNYGTYCGYVRNSTGYTCDQPQCHASTPSSPNPTTPPPGPQCLSISMTNISKSGNSIQGGPTGTITNAPAPGDAVRFTCGTVAGANHYIFRVIQPDNHTVTLTATGATSTPYTITSAGKYIAQCQICTGADASTCHPFEPIASPGSSTIQ